MNRLLLLFTITLFCFSGLSAQKLTYILGDVLVRPVEGQKIKDILEGLRYFHHLPTEIKIVKQVSKPLNIWLLQFDYNQINELQFLDFLNNNINIQTAQFNHLVKMRSTVPDDPLFTDQWQYINDGSAGGVVDADIDADLAWDITTGGVTQQGDSIVVAILDSGIDLNHSDFEDNLWINHAEIPNNGIDDDNNGYVDDYRGWSIVSNSDDISANGSHGTAVAGIVGAKGNNGIGVSGVNWNVKLMIIKNNFASDEASVLEAYSYALDARQRYNDSNGAEGAFVVSTNASWGVDFGDPANAPLWCAFYDTLGQAGITSCAATINGNENVDEVGDLPTACPSDFLIAVTNMNRSDNKVTGAGYGAMSIDIGAHGEDAFTTSLGNNYSEFGGTSGASPHVAGAIALLYSAPCDNLIALAKADPAAGAALARQYIFDGVDANSSLVGITTTEGRLNLFNSLEILMDNCSPCPNAFNLGVSNVLDVSANLVWSPGTNAVSSNLRWRQIGSPTWNETINASSPFQINGLTACTDYEFQIEAICDMESSGYTESHVFTSEGCCDPPIGISINGISSTFASVVWTPVFAAQSYTLVVNAPNGGSFIFSGLTSSSFPLMNLDPCTEYSVSIQTICANENSPFSTPVNFSTFGCGACTDFEYCESEGENANFEWIESVVIGDLNNTSGMDNGYGDYTDINVDFLIGENYTVALTPGFDANAFDEYFKVWIDYDQNGEFDPDTELAFDASVGSETTVNGSLDIPGSAVIGKTRMRIGMQWVGPNDIEEPEVCESINFGEVEDYCINILPASCDLPINLDTVEVFETEALLIWEDPSDDHSDHNLRIKKIQNTDWVLYENVSPPLMVDGLSDCSSYEFQVEANCLTGGSTSGFTNSYNFETQCLDNIEDPILDQTIKVYPNPFTETFHIDINLKSADRIFFQILNTSGQSVYQGFYEISSGFQTISIVQLDNLPSGIYFLSIASSDGIFYKKVVKE